MKKYDMKVNDLLFKLSDMYCQENYVFDNNIGENIFGKLISHRVINIAYSKLRDDKEINMGEYKKFFEIIYQQSLAENKEYEKELAYICDILCGAKFKFALLKGAFLISNVYPKGLRASNDIDILIDEKDIDECQSILLANGFVQGEVKNGVEHKATRSEIILSRMNYGETIPFYKKFGERYIFIDINFSLDYKPSQDARIIHEMLDNTVNINWNNTILTTLNIGDFIIHLCMHLYKEASTIDWVRRRKDLNLYKFCDLNVVFHELVTEDVYEELLERILHHGVEKECYYALLLSAKIYNGLMNNKRYTDLLSRIKPKNTQYLNQIVDPENKKIYSYDMSFEEWFACNERYKYLLEV